MTYDGPPWARRIRALRQELEARIPSQYSQSGLARQLGVSNESVRAWESGRWKPRKAMARRLARTLGVKVEDLELDSAESAAKTGGDAEEPRSGAGGVG